MRMHATRSLTPHIVLAAIVALALAAGAAAARALALPDGADDYNSPGFIVRHAWEKFAYLGGEPFRDGLSPAEEDARIARFFELNGLIADRSRTATDPEAQPDAARIAAAAAATLRAERARIENSVERIIEGRLTHVLKEQGLTRRVGGDLLWPPVDIEFEDAPSVLVTSPRSRIEKRGESLVRGDLPPERIERIEAAAERDGETSALVVRIGAIAMYPSIIPPSRDYAGTMETAAHEWLHHYLWFAPLGRRYYQDGRLTTLNETVANMAGRELGEAFVRAYPLARIEASDALPPAAPGDTPAIDFTAEMRGLRHDVESLLAAGRIEDAERLMDEKRRFLAGHGYYIRRLNQAYFAFHGSYADTPGSIDPIGPKLQSLRERSASVSAFVETARGLTSERDLDAALGATP